MPELRRSDAVHATLRVTDPSRIDGKLQIGLICTALHDVKVESYDAQGHLNNAAIVRIFNDIRIAYVQQRLGDRWREHLGAEGLVVVAREVHVLYESEGFPTDEYVGAMRYVRREGRAAIIEQRLTEATSARAVARAWVVQLVRRVGSGSQLKLTHCRRVV